MERLDTPHVPYTLIWNKDAPYSVYVDFVELYDIEEAIRAVLSTDTDELYIDEYRIAAIVSFVKRRLENLEQIINESRGDRPMQTDTSTNDAVEKNVAEDYS